MEITEVRIKLMEDSDDRLQAFCSVTFDHAFVVRDLKIIDGANGPFVAMPSRKLTSHCPQCGYKNHLRAHFCNQCGTRLWEDRAVRDAEGRVKLYADIAHPIHAACREQIQSRVIAEFRAELERAQQPGYVSRYDEDYELDYEEEGGGTTPRETARSTTSAPPAATPPQATSGEPVTHPASPATPRPEAESPAAVPAARAGGSPVRPSGSTAAPPAGPTRTHVPQPAAAEPRPPHRPAGSSPPPARRIANRAFGAGIFDEPAES